MQSYFKKTHPSKISTFRNMATKLCKEYSKDMFVSHKIHLEFHIHTHTHKMFNTLNAYKR